MTHHDTLRMTYLQHRTEYVRSSFDHLSETLFMFFRTKTVPANTAVEIVPISEPVYVEEFPDDRDSQSRTTGPV